MPPEYLVLNKKLGSWCFGVGIDLCSKNCELFENGLIPYCQQATRRNKKGMNPRFKKSEKLLKSKSFEKIISLDIRKSRSFLIRLYDYGDLLCVEDLIKWVNVAKMNSKTNFWLSTRQDSILFDYFVNKGLKKPVNLVIRYSLDQIETPKFLLDFFDKYGIVRSIITPDKELANCNASKTGSCGDCVDCWDPLKKLIIYFNHGQMKHRLKDYLRFFN